MTSQDNSASGAGDQQGSGQQGGQQAGQQGGQPGASLHDRVKAVIEKIRPFIQSDGGDIRLVRVDDDGLVTVQLQGACVGCPGSRMTLKMGVERHLRERVPEVREVVAI